ncbi:MAG: PAS domain-containing protein [Deltaproteobacteria bacterium]|nr:PAS domain-containing protein [Deltaproteobacteria bacterium]
MPAARCSRSTSFAPAERADPATLEAQRAMIASEPLVREMLEAFPEPAVILNAERQILVANRKMQEMLGREEERMAGCRIGEVLRCEHADDEPNGCGTTRFCRNCGAAKAMVRFGATGRAAVDECRIVRDPASRLPALDLRVWASPLAVRGERFAIFAVRDTSDEKRRAVLERIFFHDVLNAAGGLQGLIGLLLEAEPDEREEFGNMARLLSEQIVEEIGAQRDLVAAEGGELEPELREVDAAKLLEYLVAVHERQPIAAARHIRITATEGATLILTDEVILRRVLGNLVKNALEASTAGETVSLAFRNEGALEFRVHNDAVMPDVVRDQIFQRSFTTKPGGGRGIGTYSIKLLTERYLGGSVSFTTSAKGGTTFTVSLPGVARSD